jgi:succinate dehydrogenase/fumarate reductase flavoprotein subunit
LDESIHEHEDKAAGLTPVALGKKYKEQRLSFNVPQALIKDKSMVNNGNTYSPSLDSIVSKRIQTDVLVVGGGIAGVFAAINARKEDVDVALVDKGTVGKSGKSPFFYGYTGFENISDAEKQAIKEKWSKDAEYLIDKPYMDNLIDESSARRDDLLSWGLGGKPKEEFGLRFRKKVVESGVQVIERTMVTDLMVQGGHAIGAIGFSLDRDEMVIIHANVVVMCSGSGAFKSPGYAICSLTHDGDAMAYRAGGEISGKEFVDFHTTGSENPADLMRIRGQVCS